MNALYDAPAEAEEAAYLEEFELGLVAEDDDTQDAPSPWIARACAAGALAAHIVLVAIVLGTGLGWSFTHRGADFARVIDVELEPRLPRIERVAIPDAPEEAAAVPAEDRLALRSDAPEEAAGVPAQDRLALRSALDALALAGDAETLETIASNLNAETDLGAGPLPAVGGEPSEIAASGPPINVAQGAESPVASSPPALSLSLRPAPDLTVKSDMRALAEAQERPAVVASEVAEDAVIARPASEQVHEPSLAEARPGDVGETVTAELGLDKTRGEVVRARQGDVGETVIAQTEPEAAESEAEQGSAEDADGLAAQAAEARRAAAKKVAADRARAADAAKKAAADRARRETAASAARKRNEEARRREAEKRKSAAKKKSQAGAKSNKLGSARRYAGMVRARVAAQKPALKGPSSVSVAYAVAENGSLRYAQIAGASNSGFFMNQASLAAVRRAAPFPPPPAGMSPGQLSFTVTFTYR